MDCGGPGKTGVSKAMEGRWHLPKWVRAKMQRQDDVAMSIHTSICDRSCLFRVTQAMVR